MPPSPCMQVVSQLTALLPWENWSRYKQGCGHGKDMRPGVSVHRFWLQLLTTVAPSCVSSSGHCFQYPTWKTHNHFDIVSSLSPLYYSVGRDGSTHTLWLLWLTDDTGNTLEPDNVFVLEPRPWPGDRGCVRAEYVRMWPLHGDRWLLVLRNDPSVPQPVFTITEKAPYRGVNTRLA